MADVKKTYGNLTLCTAFSTIYAILRREICLAGRTLCDFLVEQSGGGGKDRETLTQRWTQYF